MLHLEADNRRDVAPVIQGDAADNSPCPEVTSEFARRKGLLEFTALSGC